MFVKILMSVCAVSLALFIGAENAYVGSSEAFGKDRTFLEESTSFPKSEIDPTPEATELPNVVISYETEKEEITFETVYIADPTLIYGKEVVACEGALGERAYTYEVVTSGEKRLSKTLVGEEITKEPVDRVIHYGNDPTTPSGEFIFPTVGKITSKYGS